MVTASRWLLVSLFITFALVSPRAGATYAGAQPFAAAPALTDLRSVGELRERFNGDQGTTRLVLLVSPT